MMQGIAESRGGEGEKGGTRRACGSGREIFFKGAGKPEGRREIEIGGRGRERRGKERYRMGGSTTRNVYL